MTEKDVHHAGIRSSITAEAPLLAVVQRLTEHGIIRADEASDMFALLTAISGGSPHRLPARSRSTASGAEPKRHRHATRIDRLR